MEGKSLRDLDAAIANISRNIQAYYSGDPYAYLTVAVELRKLLCDNKGNSDRSLVLRDNPEFSLHPLRSGSLPIDGPNVFVFRGPMTFDGRSAGFIGSLFDEKANLIKLSDWRTQQLVSQKITIRELIKSVADKEGAHSDPEAGDTLNLLQSVRFESGLGSDSELIASIGHYILRNLLMRRLLLLRADLMTHFQSQRESLGAGALRLSMKGSPRPYSEGLDLDYLTATTVREMSGGDDSKRLMAADMMRTHSSSDSFLLWTEDLHGGIWLNQIGTNA